MEDKSQVTYALSSSGMTKLARLKDDGHFGTEVDAYRFAIALALASGAKPKAPTGKRTTKYNVGTLDLDGSLRFAVRTFAVSHEFSVDKALEYLAEWGIDRLSSMADSGEIPFESILTEADSLGS